MCLCHNHDSSLLEIKQFRLEAMLQILSTHTLLTLLTTGKVFLVTTSKMRHNLGSNVT